MHRNFLTLFPILIVLYLTLPCLLSAQNALQNVYYSGINSQSEISLLWNSDRTDEVLYYHEDSIQSSASMPYYNYTDWFKATIPVPSHPYIGFKGIGADTRINPIYWDFVPSMDIDKFTFLSTDPTGDQSFSNTNLDITDSYVSFTEDRIHFAIRNSGTGFPINSGLTYFSYMAILVNPAADPADNPPVYGLMYTVNLAGVISPGLYKITGTGFGGLQNLGSIESSIDTETNTLFLSCNKADLYADTDFMSWYDPLYPLVGSMIITSRINIVNGIQEADRSEAANLLFLPRQISDQNMHQPSLSNLEYQIEDQEINISVLYSDLDHNFPLESSLYLDGVYLGELYPSGDIDFSMEQIFESETISIPLEWQVLELRFSDNGIDFVSETIVNTAVNTNVLIPNFDFKLYPNPAHSMIKLSIMTNQTPRSIQIYNLRGQLVSSSFLNAKDAKGEYSIDVSILSPGLYILKHGDKQRKFVITD